MNYGVVAISTETKVDIALKYGLKYTNTYYIQVKTPGHQGIQKYFFSSTVNDESQFEKPIK